MNRRQLLNALTSAEKKLDNMQENFKNQAELIKFIKTKLKASIDKKQSIPARESKIIQELMKDITPEMNKKLDEEINEEMNRDYGNEL